MEKLFIDHSKDTPEINLDPKSNTFIIAGVCHPENVTKFYEPLMEWFELFKEELSKTKKPKAIKFEFFFKYINSASYKYLITILQKIYEFTQTGVSVSAIWYYEPEDVDMRDAGIELFDYSGIKIPYETKVKE